MGHFYQACPMRQRAGEAVHTATAISWADIAAKGAGGTRKAGNRWKKRRREEFTEHEERRRGRVKHNPTERDHPPGRPRVATNTWAEDDRQK